MSLLTYSIVKDKRSVTVKSDFNMLIYIDIIFCLIRWVGRVLTRMTKSPF